MTQQFIKWPFSGRWIMGGLGLILLLMGLVCLASLKNTDEIKHGANRVQQTYKTINALTNFHAALTAAESARRGYIFLGSSQDLQRYHQAISNIQSEMKYLQKHTNPTLLQKQKLENLNLLVNQRLKLLTESIELYKKDKTAVKAQNNITERSVKLREKILNIIADIKVEEQNHLQNSLEESKQNIYWRILMEILGTILSLIVILGLFILLETQAIKRERIRALETSLAQEKKLGDLKVQLFSMISHEFRTPLSVILLSSQLLRETLEGLVDEKQYKNLYRIQSSAKLMNHIVTDILTLTTADY